MNVFSCVSDSDFSITIWISLMPPAQRMVRLPLLAVVEQELDGCRRPAMAVQLSDETKASS